MTKELVVIMQYSNTLNQVFKYLASICVFELYSNTLKVQSICILCKYFHQVFVTTPSFI